MTTRHRQYDLDTYLEEPIAAPVEGGQYSRVDVAAVDALLSLHLQLHVVLAGGLAVLALLPAVAVPTIPDPLSRVKQH